MANRKYGMTTVRDVVEAVKGDPANFPKGLDTPIYTGDFEGNYTHTKHEVMSDGGKCVFLGYEMHEGFAC